MQLILAPLRLPATLFGHRFLLRQLAWRAFSARHAGNYLGWLWTPLSTVLQVVLYVVVFSAILKIKVEGLGIDLASRPDVGFGMFLVTGLVPFLAVNDAVLRAARVLRAHANLVQRVRFPVEVLVVGDTAGALLHHAIAFGLVIAYCGATGHMLPSGALWVSLGVVITLLWIVGLSLSISVVAAFLPDIVEVLALALQVAFYGAPIVYPLSLIHEETLLTLVHSNPVTPLVGIFRAGLLGATAPSLAAVGVMLGAGLLLVAAGAAAVERWRYSIPDSL